MADDVNGTSASAPAPKSEITVGGRIFDITKAFPLTLADWERMEDQGVVVEGQIKLSSKSIINVLTMLVQKLDASVTREMVAAMPMTDLPDIGAVLARMATREEEAVKSPM